MDEYQMFITDFSSFQFDFVRLVRPIAYFLPDKKELRAGLHTYRSLDLKYEDAFGPLTETSEDLLAFMKETIESGFAVRAPYRERMENFFTIAEDPCEEIYLALR